MAGLAAAAEIARLGLSVHPSLGNFVLVEFPAVAGQDARRPPMPGSKAEGIIPRQMDAYGLPHCLRISVGLEDENRRVVEALARLRRLGGRRHDALRARRHAWASG